VHCASFIFSSLLRREGEGGRVVYVCIVGGGGVECWLVGVDNFAEDRTSWLVPRVADSHLIGQCVLNDGGVHEACRLFVQVC
jgi:hypothetical protein